MNETEIERLVVRIVGDMTQYQQTLKQAEGATRSSVSGIMAAFGPLLAILGPITLAYKAWGLIQWGGSLAGQAEEAQISFEVMLGSVDKAKAMLEEMRIFGAQTPLNTADIQSAGKTLMQFGVAGDNVMPILKMLGDVTGGNAQRFSMLSLSFGQMAAAGRLMGQDLLQMINAGFNPLQEMSKKTGKSMGDLKKEMEQGKISVGMVVQAFQDATKAGGSFDGMMQKQSQSLSGLMSTLEDNFGQSMMKISQTLMSGVDFRGMVTSLIEFFGTFSENYEENLTALTDWAKGIWTSVTEHIQTEYGFIIDYGVQTWDYLITVVQNFVMKTIGFFSNLRENLSAIWLWLGDNWKALLVDMINMIGVFATNMINNAVVTIRTYVRLYTAFAGWFVGMMKRIFTFEVVDAILTGLIKAGEKIREWAAAAWESIKAIFTGKKAPGALDAFIEQAKGDFAKGMENSDLLGTFKGILEEESKNIKNPLEGFESSITEGPKLNLTPDGSSLPDFVWKTGNDAKGAFNTAITGMGDPVTKEVKKAKAAMKDLDAVAFTSAEAVARVMDYKMNRMAGSIKSNAAGAGVMPMRQQATPQMAAAPGMRGGRSGSSNDPALNYLRIIAENTSILKEKEQNKSKTIEGVDFAASNVGEIA